MKMRKVIAATSIAALIAGPALAEGSVSVLTWEGYADPSFIDQFEAESGCAVSATYVGSNDDFAPKIMSGGGIYDLITPSIDTTALMIDLGFVEALDTAQLNGWDDIYPKFLGLEGIQRDGAFYGMPYSWGAIAFMYRNDAFETPPTSLDALWSEDNAGKISLWDDKSSIYVAARKNGDMDIYALTDEQIAAATDTLVAQKPLVRKYWSTAGELVDLYKAGEVVISNTWAGYQSSLLADEGIEVTEFIPTEGAEGWLDAWMVVKDTPNRECAYKFLNMQLSELGQCGVANVNGYSAANAVAARNCMTDEQFAALHQDDPDYLDSLMIWTPLGDRFEAYLNAWNNVKSQ